MPTSRSFVLISLTVSTLISVGVVRALPVARPGPSEALRSGVGERGQPTDQPATSSASAPQPSVSPSSDWRSLESADLANHVQLTKREQFVKAGEAYFSPDGAWIIFQAVEVPKKGLDGTTPEPATSYSLYVAKLMHDAGGRVTGLGEAFMVSPPGSANTCGWFHPTERARILYASTIGPPAPGVTPGYQRGTRSYMWSFPPEMEIVTQTVLPMAKDYGLKPGVQCGSDFLAAPVFTREGYDAECSYSKDGRFIIYTHVDDKRDAAGVPLKADGDIWVYDTLSQEHRPLVVAPGYDGGPFLSPDGKRLCYRSDRKGNDLLQIYICDLVYADGVPTGITNERKITDNDWVNWAPYWHPSGKFLVYGTSQADHNYEIYAVDVDPIDAKKPVTHEPRRVTNAAGADVLPVFSPDGKLMMWTSQRGPMAEGETKPSSQLWVAEWVAK